MPWNGTIYTLDRGLSRLQKTMWSQIAPRPENIPPKGVGFSDFICIFAILKEVFCKDTHFLRKDKARACESLGFVVNKNVFFNSVSGKRRKNEKGAP